MMLDDVQASSHIPVKPGFVPGHIHGLISHEGVAWLWEQSTRMDSIVEVGCWKGGSTYALCSGCTGTVYAVDHWLGSPDPTDATHGPAYDIHAEFMRNVGHFPNLKILRMDSVIAAEQFRPRTIDMVVIDAGHDTPSVTADLRAWLPICKTLLCGHDWGHATVKNALQALGREIHHHPGDMWSIRCDA